MCNFKDALTLLGRPCKENFLSFPHFSSCTPFQLLAQARGEAPLSETARNPMIHSVGGSELIVNLVVGVTFSTRLC